MTKKNQNGKNLSNYKIEPLDDGCDCLRLIFLSAMSRTLTNPPINNHPTLHISHPLLR